MKTNEEVLTLREVLQKTRVAPRSKKGRGEKMPTDRRLRSSGTPVIAEWATADEKIVVYENGYFSYTSGHRRTVQRVHACVNGVTYKFANGQSQVLNFKVFENLPFMIWMTLEGERRLEQNQASYEENRVLSIDQFPITTEKIRSKLDSIFSKEALSVALALLTDRQKTIVSAYFIDEKSQQEIADMLHISQQAVHAQLQTSLKKIADSKNFFEKLSK